MSAVVKVDSNITGLRYAEELSLKTLDPTTANQRWIGLEPNSYADFGGKVTTVARNPINPSRQRKKGVVTNVTASAGFDMDLTQKNAQDMLQGFFFADLRRKAEYGILAGTITAIATADDSYAGSGINTNFLAGDLIFAAGNVQSANNGLHLVASVSSGKVLVSENLVNETPPAGSSIVKVGFQFTAGDATLDASGSLPKLVTVTKDLTQLGLIPGEFMYIGGDGANFKFFNATNNGWVRVRSVAAHAITFDKASGVMVTDDGTSTGSGGTNLTIQVFIGRALKNESGTLIKRRTYTLERTLGYSDSADVTKEQADYSKGSVPNEFTLNLKSADKITADLAFVACTPAALDENVSGANTLLSKISGVVRVDPPEADAFNTSSDFSRIRLSEVIAGNEFVTPLFTYSEEATLTLKNNASPNNALGVLGAFEVTAGTFEIGGSITAYFGSVAGTQAVQNNADITFDFAIAKANAGIALDFPLISLGNGQPTVAQDQPIKLPLDMPAASGSKIDPNLNHTLFIVFFDYLPSAAEQ